MIEKLAKNWGYLLVVVVILISYGRGINNDFTYDDRGLVLQDQRITTADWGAIISQSYWGDAGDGLYRPITTASLAINWWVNQDRAWGYHLFNLILHVFIAVLLMFAGARSGDEKAGLIMALLYSVHPAFSEAVFGISGRAELLASFFGLLAIHCFMWKREGQTNNNEWICSGFVCLLAAILAKENGIAFAMGLIAWGTYRKRKIEIVGCISIIAIGVATLCKWLAIGVFRPEGIGYLDNPLAYESISLRCANGFGLVIRAGLKLVFPWPLAADYSPQQIQIYEHWAEPGVLLPMLLVISLLWCAAKLVKVNSESALWVGICGGAILIVSNLFIATGTIFAERLLYIPGIGFAIGMGWAISRLIPRHMTWVLTGWIVVSSGLLWQRAADWRNDLTLFSSAVLVHPHSARSHYGLGLALHREGGFEMALQEYDRAIELYPRYFEARLNRAAVLLGMGKYKAAKNAYQKVLEVRPTHFQARYALSLLEGNLGNKAWAESTLRQLHSERPTDLKVLRDLAGLLLGQGKYEAAEIMILQGLRIEPENRELRILQGELNRGRKRLLP